MKSYKDLKLDQEYIDIAIQNWCEENKLEIVEVKLMNTNYERYKIAPDILLDVYFKGETVTFSPIGSNTKRGAELADYIISNCLTNDKIKDTNFSLKSISNKQFEELILSLKKSNNSDHLDFLIKEKPISFYSLKSIGRHSKLKDYIHLTHYKNGTFLLQGRRNITFNEVINFLSQIIDNKIIIKAQLDTFENTNGITAEQSLQILENKIPHLYNHLPEELKISIAPTITLKALNIPLTEYSVLAFPVLKGLEGVLKLLFKIANKNIGNDGFGTYIECEKIKPAHISHFVSCKMKEDIEELYEVYKKYRHPLFHVDGNITTMKIVDDREEIYQIIDDIFVRLNCIRYFRT